MVQKHLTLSGNGVIGNANVGDSKALTNVSGLTLGNGSNGGLAANYTLSGGTQVLSVTKRPVTISGSRFYDGTTSVSSSDIDTFNNRVSGQSLTITGSGTVSTALSGSGKTIILGTLSLADGSGGLASNYFLSGGTFDVNSRQLNVSGSRVYDNTSTVNGSDLVVSTGVGVEVMTLSGQGSIANANVGDNKTVTQNTLSLVSASGSASNYSLGTISVNITKRPVNVSLEKVYDGSLNAPASGLKTNGITNTVGGQTLTLSGIGTMQDTGAGVAKVLSNNGTLALGSGSGSASNYTLVSGTHIIDVTPRTTVASGSRFYDGTTNAQGSSFSSFTNTVGSDTITLSGTGTISSAPIGSKSVSIGSLQSAHPSYTLTGASLNVTKRPLNLSGTRVANTNSTDINASELRFTNLPGSETLTLTGVGSIPNPRPGTKTITLGTLNFSDGSGQASNYTFVGGSFIFILKNPLNTKAGVLDFLKTMSRGGSKRMLPSRTSHRRMPAVAENYNFNT